MTGIRLFKTVIPALALSLALLPACVDDSENPTPVDPTLDASFLGYSNPATRQTTCGNCHVDKQRSWAQTAHAHAWDGLQNSGHARASCNPCHTTNGTGNLAADTSGYLAVSANAQPYYLDVQCESCHGPGSGHITAPDDAQPLSTIFADTGATVGCATCHTGTHHGFVNDWRESGHAVPNDHAATNPSCAGCHEGRGALARFDPNARYLEQTEADVQGITCAVCHDPHGSDNPAQLRLSASSPTLETNLCMACHQRRFAPDPTSTRGAHSPQGPMVLGEAGYEPPNFQYDAARQASSHGVNANPGLCRTCHIERYNVTDSLTGAFVVNVTGHRFQAIPCVDGQGQPTGAASCPDTERRFNACVSGACHTSTASVMGLRQVLEGRLDNLVRQLWIDANANGRLDAFPADSGLLAITKQMTPGDFSTSGGGELVITVGEGVWFNADLVKNSDGSEGVHNPFYAEALLLGSITALRAQYPYLPAPRPAEQQLITTRMRALGMIH